MVAGRPQFAVDVIFSIAGSRGRSANREPENAKMHNRWRRSANTAYDECRRGRLNAANPKRAEGEFLCKFGIKAD
jgi:hypothetical protein